ncbi:MAG: hypothetical protein KIT68_12645 [Phycisphaeraceae bacterium]|nr:hypothetical protein [Phycisphaeraceae bacterium]
MSKRPVTTDRAAFDTRATVRCAIYTRKSSEEGLEQEFNSLDAQQESRHPTARSYGLERGRFSTADHRLAPKALHRGCSDCPLCT